MLKHMKILVTGGTGFIGSHVVDNLLAKGHKVTIFERENSFLLQKNASIFLGDIKDKEAITTAISSHDAVIHLAGILGTAETIENPLFSIQVNIIGALNCYEAIKQYRKKAVVITVGNYTWNNSYAISKYTAERFALMYNKEHGTKIAVVRGLNVYGPRQKAYPVKKVVPNFILSALTNKNIEIFGDGQQLMDLIYVEDTAEILARALLLEHGVFSNVIEAGSGKLVTVDELARLIIKIAKSKSKIVYLPMRSGEPVRSITKGDPSTLTPIGWREEDFVSLEKGLSKTISWYAKHLNDFTNNQLFIEKRDSGSPVLPPTLRRKKSPGRRKK